MSQSYKTKWKVTRAKGIWWYVVPRGLLMGAAWLAAFVAKNTLWDRNYQTEDLLYIVPFSFGIGLLGFFLIWMWNEAVYK